MTSPMPSPAETYLETDAEVADVAAGALAFIVESDDLGEPYDLRGLGVYGVIAMLRENDELIYGEASPLDDAARERADRVVATVDAAVEKGMQFYPFGHKRTADDYKTDGSDHNQRAMIRPGGSIDEVRPHRLRTTVHDEPRRRR